MSITYQVEHYTDVTTELAQLYPLHHKEVAENVREIPLAPDWDRYHKMAEDGTLLLVTARDDKELIGYFKALIAPHLHYRHSLTAQTDIFFLHPDYRKQRAGYNLLKFAVSEIKSRGVQRIYIGCKISHDLGKLFERLGFHEVERHYSMFLGDNDV